MLAVNRIDQTFQKLDKALVRIELLPQVGMLRDDRRIDDREVFRIDIEIITIQLRHRFIPLQLSKNHLQDALHILLMRFFFGLAVLLEGSALQIQVEGSVNQLRIVDGQSFQHALHGVSIQAENAGGADALADFIVVHQVGEAEIVVAVAFVGELVEGIEDDAGVGVFPRTSCYRI